MDKKQKLPANFVIKLASNFIKSANFVLKAADFIKKVAEKIIKLADFIIKSADFETELARKIIKLADLMFKVPHLTLKSAAILKNYILGF